MKRLHDHLQMYLVCEFFLVQSRYVPSGCPVLREDLLYWVRKLTSEFVSLGIITLALLFE